MERSRRVHGLRGRRESLAVLSIFSAILCLWGCSAGPSEDDTGSSRWVSLVDAFPLADVSLPTRLIDFRQEDAQAHLVRGWSTGRRLDKGPEGLWSLGDGAELEFFVASPRDLEVTLRCAPTAPPPRRGLGLALAVNGQPWTAVSLKPKMHTFVLQLSASLLHAGRNRLVIDHTGSPRSGDVRTGKDFRVLWKFIRFDQGLPSQTAAPQTSENGSVLFLPVGARADFYLASSVRRFAFERATRRKMSSGRFELSWTNTDGGSQVIVEDLFDWPEKWVDLSQLEGSQGRLSLTVVPGEDGEFSAEAGAVLLSPQLEAEVEDAGKEPATGPRFGGQPASLPNVVLYVVDTLRADHLGCYGYGRQVSPHIDSFAETAAVFLNAQAQSPWTRASVASILTGLWPHQHTANDDHDALPDQVTTLAEILAAAGYKTHAVSSNSNASEVFGFDQGFDSFQRLKRDGEDGPPPRSTEVNAAAFQWLEESSGQQPFFLFLHTIDPHAPYRPPEPFRVKFAPDVVDLEVGSVERVQALAQDRAPVPETTVRDLLDLYAAEVAANDHGFGELVTFLKGKNIFESTLIVVVSDHGEEFNEHGQWTHGKTLFSEVIDVPLIVRLPNSTMGRKIQEVVQQVDILPTILDHLGLDIPPGVAGRSLLPLITSGRDPDWPQWAVSQMQLRGRTATSYIGNDWKVIVPRFDDRDGFPMLFDRRKDRQEIEDLAGSRDELARFWASRLRGAIAAAPISADSQWVSDEEQAELEDDLRALGYIQ